MGVAIIGILLFHGHAVLYGGVGGYFFAGVKLFMQIGVDIFFFLSGFGCYHSLRNSNIRTQPLHAICAFYVRRLKRLLPKYLLVVSLYCVFIKCFFKELTWLQVYTRFSLITFFTQGELSEWFIASILTLYLITPPLYLLLNANNRAFFCMIVFTAMASLCISLGRVPYSLMIVNEIFFTRIPVYLAGLLLGKQYAGGLCSVRRKTAILICVVFLAAYGFNRIVNQVNEVAFERLLFCPLAIAITFLLASGFESLRTSGQIVFFFLGGITLELYLVHEKLLNIIQQMLYPESPDFLQLLIVDFFAVLASIAIAAVIHRLFLLSRKEQGRVPTG